MSVAAVSCSGQGPSRLREASQKVLSRVQQHEATTRLQLPPDAVEPMELEWTNVKIDSLLGTGSFSVVYKARVKALNRERHASDGDRFYALKSLSTETICCNESFVTGAIDLALEASILSKLHHENVIEVYGVKGGNIAESFSHAQVQAGGGGFFMVMDLLEETLDRRLETWRKEDAKLSGGTLNALFHRKRRVQKRLQGVAHRIETVVGGIIRGMEYVHSKNIILRDLKPHNIGFDRRGKVRIFDFGLARELASDGTPTGLIPRCNTGIAGTLRYISPENALGQPCGLSVDVYSFAILLYEVMTLQVPFEDIKLVQHFKEKVIRGRHRPNLKFVPSAILQDLLRDAWDPNPHARPSFAEIRCIMDELLSQGLLTNDKDVWRKIVFKKAKPTQTCCRNHNMDSSVGGGSIRRLSGSHKNANPIHHAPHHSHDLVADHDHSKDLKHVLKDHDDKQHPTTSDVVAANRRAGMSGSYHGGLNDQMRSFTENISFNSQRAQVHPL